MGEIVKLNPRPGSSMGEAMGRSFQQIIPDFIVETYDDGAINLTLNNRNTPQLHINREFRDLMEEHGITYLVSFILHIFHWSNALVKGRHYINHHCSRVRVWPI